MDFDKQFSRQLKPSEIGLEQWRDRCRRFSRNLSGRTFSSISERESFCLSGYSDALDIPLNLIGKRERPAGVESHGMSGFFKATLICHRADGLELDVSRNMSYALHLPVPFTGKVHRHSYIELFYIIDGEFSQTLLGQEYTFSAGTFVVTDKNCAHADIIHPVDSSILFLWLDSAFLEVLLGTEAVTNEFERFLFHAISEKKREQSFLIFEKKDMDSDYSSSMKRLLELIVSEEFAREPGFRPVLSGLLIRLFHRLGNDYTMVRHTDESGKSEQLLLFEIEKYIRKNPKNCTAADLQKVFHYNSAYYSKLLKKYRGKGLKEYVQDVRLKKACELLTSTGLPVRTISEEVGYLNTNFFYHLFEDYAGCSPRDYRAKR